VGDTQWCVNVVDDTPTHYEIKIGNSNLTKSVIQLRISRDIWKNRTLQIALYNGTWYVKNIELRHVQTQQTFIDWLKGLNIWQS
jgi:hypothetical protein